MSIAITKGNQGAGIWCDRRSPLGNPFPMRHQSERDRVCDAYQEYFDWMLQSDAGWQEATKLVVAISHEHDVAYSIGFDIPSPARFRKEFDRFSTPLKADGNLTLKCWCINVEVKSRADLVQKKRCHCLSIAGYLLPEVGSFAEQLKLGV